MPSWQDSSTAPSQRESNSRVLAPTHGDGRESLPERNSLEKPAEQATRAGSVHATRNRAVTLPGFRSFCGSNTKVGAPRRRSSFFISTH